MTQFVFAPGGTFGIVLLAADVLAQYQSVEWESFESGQMKSQILIIGNPSKLSVALGPDSEHAPSVSPFRNWQIWIGDPWSPASDEIRGQKTAWMNTFRGFAILSF
jgi:hypothetical protein